MRFSRRTVIAAPAILSGVAVLSSLAVAKAPPAKTQAAGVYRFKLGAYQLTALYDGLWPVKIEDSLIRNASNTEVDASLAAAFLPPGVLQVNFTALLINTGSKLVLIDTGTAGQIVDSAGTLLANLAAAGVKPAAIDTILISHFHPDHINGIKDKDGWPVFENAEILVPAPEWAYWMDDATMNAAPEAGRGSFLNARRIFRDMAREVKRFEPGKEVAPGITSIAAYGHTPGHTAYAVASGNQSMLVLGDTTNHPWLFARNPHWQGMFDTDGNMAVETRKRLLDRAAADKMLVHGYHFPFPASGHIAKTATGYEVVPVMWQPM
jgi:glyoxylase-like metal-dependent hydrolase (beta-lactamase superfamily II)